MTRQWRKVVHALVILAVTLLMSLLILYFAEYFGVPFVREAGGRVG